MKQLTLHLIYLPLLAALAFLSLHLAQSSRASLQRMKMNDLRTEAAAKELQSRFHDQSLEFISNYRETSRQAFAEVLEKLTLYRQLSSRSEQTLQEMLTKRQALMERLRSEPDLKSVRMKEMIDLDNQILEAYRDYANLQDLHRQNLFRQLEPIAEQTGLKPAS